MNRHRWIALCCFGPFVTLLWLFVGIEVTPREHRTEYELFVKQVPTLQSVYRNPAVCGECDVAPFASLPSAVMSEFAAFCRVRFGLTQVRACYGIYLEQQRLANEGRTDLVKPPEAIGSPCGVELRARHASSETQAEVEGDSK